MRELLVDAEALYTRAELHEALARAFDFAEGYGGTLDALYDELYYCAPTQLTLVNAESLVINLGDYGELVLRVLAGAAAENEDFILNIE
nr:barstar family protein [uncultured Agathobaculum sp.]